MRVTASRISSAERGVGKAHEGPAVDRIEIDARRCRDMGLFEHAAGEFKTVRGEIGNIGIEVERAVGREKPGQAGLRQAFDQNATVLLIAALDRLHLVGAGKRGFGGNLRQRRHRDRQVLLQPFDRPHQRLRRHHPSDPPAGHAKIFRERVDDQRLRRELGCGDGGKSVIEAVIDLVGNEADAGAFRRADQAGQRLARHHRSRRIGGTADQHALQRRPAMRRQQRFAGQGVTRLVRGLDQHRLATQRREDMAVGRIAGHGHGNPVAGSEHRQKCQNEPARRAGGDHDPVGVDRTAVSILIMPADSGPQRGNAERRRIIDPGFIERRMGRRYRDLRGRGRRLADFHMDHMPAGRLDARRRRHHIHHHERGDVAPGRGGQQGFHRIGWGRLVHRSLLFAGTAPISDSRTGSAPDWPHCVACYSVFRPNDTRYATRKLL